MTKIIQSITSALILLMMVGVAVGYSYTSTGFKAPWFATDNENFNTSTNAGNFNQSYSYLVYTDGTTTYAKNGRTGLVEFSGTDAAQVIQNAINQSGGLVFLKNGTYITSAARPTILIRENVTLKGSGIKNTIIKCGDGIQKTVIEMDNFSTLQDISIDGNYQNNLAGEGTWVTVDDVPHAQGVYTSVEIWNGTTIRLSQNTKVKNIDVYNTIRSNLVVGGYNVSVDSVYLRNSYTDHNLYMSRLWDSSVKNVYTTGMANTEAVVVGTGTGTLYGAVYNSLLENVHIFPSATGKLGATSYALRARSLGGSHNTFRDIYIQDNQTPGGSMGIVIAQPYSLLDGLKYTGNAGTADLLKISESENSIFQNIFYNIDYGTQTIDRYAVYLGGNSSNITVQNVVINMTNVSDLHFKGIAVAATVKPLTNVYLNNILLTVPGIAVRIAGDTYPVTYFTSHVQLLNSTTVQETGTVSRYGDIYPVSPWDFGKKSAAPTAFGAGDTYYDTDVNQLCIYTTSWKQIVDMTTACS